MDWIKEFGGNYVRSFEELPQGAVIFITGYDSDVRELQQARERFIREHGCEARIIKHRDDIPASVAADARVGVLMAPIPMPKKAVEIKEIIKQRFSRK